MAADSDGDLGVDVLVVGAGIQGLYIGRELAKSYSVCVVSDPSVRTTTLDAPGYLSAGYDGNDVARIQPARRAAAWWRLWAESTGVPYAPDRPWYVLPGDEVSVRSRLWSDATLTADAVDGLPEAFVGGSLEGSCAYRLDGDLVVHPPTVLAQLRQGLESSLVEGEVVRFGLVSDDAIDHVAVQVGDRVVPVVPRFVVLAAGAGNATLLGQLSARFADQARRKAAKELVAGCQAVRSQYLLCVRGDLPAVDGHFGDLTVVTHRLLDAHDGVWVVAPSVDDAHTTLGPDDLRFERPPDPALVARTVGRLFAMSPWLESRASDLRWSGFVSRHTQHPAVASPDLSSVAQPVPAKLERFDLECFLAVWPSHLAYAQIVGDSVAERVADALGPAGDFGDGLQTAALATPPAPLASRWEQPDFPWLDWPDFTAGFTFTAA